jgi:hypothetical protein
MNQKALASFREELETCKLRWPDSPTAVNFALRTLLDALLEDDDPVVRAWYAGRTMTEMAGLVDDAKEPQPAPHLPNLASEQSPGTLDPEKVSAWQRATRVAAQCAALANWSA